MNMYIVRKNKDMVLDRNGEFMNQESAAPMEFDTYFSAVRWIDIKFREETADTWEKLNQELYVVLKEQKN